MKSSRSFQNVDILTGSPAAQTHSGERPAIPQSTSNLSLASLGNDTQRRPCAYFFQGQCRNGDRCRFSHEIPSNEVSPRGSSVIHDGALSPSISRSSSRNDFNLIIPPPVLVSIPPNHPVFSIDVECVATGVQHNARSVAQVALVNEWGQPIFSVLIRQEKPVMSYLTPLTGLTKEAIDAYGLPLADAMALLRENLPPNAILVGQNIQSDVNWLQLAEGVDYHSYIDLAALFRVWDVAKGSYVTFSQDHIASVWLGMPQRAHHDAMQDAAISMFLFNSYRQVQFDLNRLRQLQSMALTSPRIPGFSSLHPVLDGCCMGNRRKCVCGAPFY